MDTLVLNQSYEVLAIISWQKAFLLLFGDKAKLLASYEDRKVRSINSSFNVPSVIVLKKYVKRKVSLIRFTRENVYLRDGGVCQYCGCKINQDNFTYDHVIPRSKGGLTCWENVVCACKKCNHEKGDLTLEECGFKLKNKPYSPTRKSFEKPWQLKGLENFPESWKDYLNV